MIKIRIEDEKQFKKDFLERMKPLVSERISFYLRFAKWQESKNQIDFDDFIKLEVTGKNRTTLLNAILKENYLMNQSEIEEFNFNQKYKHENFIDFILKYLPKVENNLDQILIYRLESLIDINNELEKIGSKRKIKTLLKHIFDYEEFTGINNEWNYSQDFTNKLNLNVCPYCNRNFVTTVLNDSGKIIGPSIDHFLSQSKFPLLRISMYNLVPSCTICNSNLKHTQQFDQVNYLYPYDDEYGDQAYFDYNLIDRDQEVESYKNYEIVVLPNPHKEDEFNQKLRGPKGNTNMKIGSLNIFQIEKIYTKAHSDLIGELELKCEQKSPYYAKSVIEFFQEDKIEDFYQYYFGNYLRKEDWNKRPLSKLTYDIVSRRLKEFGINNFQEKRSSSFSSQLQKT